MTVCPACTRPIRDGARFCDACGAALGSGDPASTVATPRRGSSGRRIDARFLPGTILDRRYRIVAPLGRGGMGEVYRADDLKLGQAVALKFLPRTLERDSERLALLLDEVKHARQVSHPNVCRVWDAGEAEGLHFIAMEYVDGEDLAALLRRIGRLPEDRAVQVAREICAGLAAIHEQGMLHRDLKPANLMLDGRGRIRITDFGLATLAGPAGADVRSGTPAYMAPEQLEGREVTVRSDLYALGLVLYELFTGHHPFAAGRDPSTRISESRPETPSSHVRSLDPVIERAILRCLEPDPASRPASALAVARALPGGDPLEAARVAGETPSPEMVAAAGGTGGLSSFAALGLVAWVVLALIAVLMLSERRGLPFGPDDKPYVALRDRATDFVRGLGYAQPGDAVVDGIARARDAAADTMAGARRGAADVFYWYRRSPFAILPVIDERNQSFDFDSNAGHDPGSLGLRLDLRGRLIEFRRVPAAGEPAADSVDWQPFFSSAQIDPATRALAASRAVPPGPADAQHAWTVGTTRGPATVEAASYRGRPTFFAVGLPHQPFRIPPSAAIARTAQAAILFVLFAAAVLLARRNLRVGRADVRGAVRIAMVQAPLSFFGFGVLAAPHSPWGQVSAIGAFTTLFYAAFHAASYLALEPIVRRRRPEWLTSWTRLLAGRWIDPLVGRDVLIGVVGGVTMCVVSGLRGNLDGTVPYGDFQAAAVGGTTAVAVVLRGFATGVLSALIWVLALVLLQIALRRELLGWIAWGVLVTIISIVGTTSMLPWGLVGAVISTAVWALTLRRAGLVGGAVATSVFGIFNEEYVTTHLGAWYSGVTVAALLAVGLLLAWGWTAAVRGTRAAEAG